MFDRVACFEKIVENRLR